MAVRFITKQVRPRFKLTAFPSETMRVIAEDVRASVMRRISMGVDVHDGPAPPLKAGYAKFKTKRYPPAIRNWRMTGFTLGHLKVTRSSPNRAIIEFLDGMRPTVSRGVKSPVSVAFIVRRNQTRSRQFGMSPHDREVFTRAIRGIRYVTVSRTA